MLAFGVGRVGGLGGGVDGVAEDLDDGLWVLVFEAGDVAEAGAAAVEAEAGDGGGEGEGEGEEGAGGMHGDGIGVGGLEWGLGKRWRGRDLCGEAVVCNSWSVCEMGETKGPFLSTLVRSSCRSVLGRIYMRST